MRRTLLAATCLVPLAALGCGSSAHKATTTRAAAPAVHYSAAKRRYLAHFNGDCGAAQRRATAQSGRIRTLTDRIAAGDRRAVAELAAFLRGLAASYRRDLAAALRLGPPPPPDAADGAAYLAAARQVTNAIAAMANAVEAADGAGVRAAERAIASATATASEASKRYGFRQCPGGGGKAGAPAGPQVLA